MTSPTLNFSGWIPAHFSHKNVDWTLLGNRRLSEPFFQETMAWQMRQPFHQLFRRTTSVKELLQWARTNPGLPLRGLIFHMSRCGSTLLAQMLAASPRTIMLSEPSPIDGAVRARQHDPELSSADHIEWIRATASALAQLRSGEETAAYMKLDCWHIHELSTLRRAFPDTPWIFLYRDPVEVMVSHMRIPSAWAVPGMLDPRALRMETSDWNPAELDRYTARSLAHICTAALRGVEEHGGMLMNYSELPGAFTARVAEHFNIDRGQLPAMMAAAERDAKQPSAAFVPDSRDKQVAATARTRALVAERLGPVYAGLEALRAAQIGATLLPNRTREEVMV